LGVSERRACQVLRQHRSTQRKLPQGRADEDRLVADMIELARQYGRYGYRRIAALLRDAGWQVNDKRVERLWRREGLKVPSRQPKKGRLWLNDGSCIRLRPEYRDHVWSYDFVHCRTDDGKVFRTLNILDEFSRECLTIRVRRKLNSTDVIDALTDLFILRGVPAFIRSDNARSSSPKPFGTGSAPSVQKRLTSSPDRPGRMVIARALTPASAMKC
jgi:putative transposase